MYFNWVTTWTVKILAAGTTVLIIGVSAIPLTAQADKPAQTLPSTRNLLRNSVLSNLSAQSVSPLPKTPSYPPLPPPEQLLPTLASPSLTEKNPPDEVPETITVERFEVIGSTVFSQANFDRLTAPYTHRPITISEVFEVRSKVTQLYLNNGYITSGAYIPPQEFRGVIKILVSEGGMEEIKVMGTRRLSSNDVRGRLAVAASKPVNRDRLLEALQRLLLNPLISNLSAELSAGTQPGTSVLEVRIQEPSIQGPDTQTRNDLPSEDRSNLIRSVLPSEDRGDLIGNSFIVTGRSGLPSSPHQVLTSNVIWTDWSTFKSPFSSDLQKARNRFESGQFADAAKLFQQAAQRYQAQGDPLNQAWAMNYLSLSYQQVGQWEAADQAITASLSLLQNSKFSSTTTQNGVQDSKLFLAQALNIHGQLQFALGQPELALTSWKQAMVAYTQIGDETGAVGSQINQVQALQMMGLNHRALADLNDVRQTLQRRPDSILTAIALLSFGNALRVTGDFDLSQKVLEQALTAAQQLQSSETIAAILLALGNTARNQQRLQEALNFYQQAVTTAVSPTVQLQAQANQLRLLVEAKQWKNAQAVWASIQPKLIALPASHQTFYARLNVAESLSTLAENSGTPPPDAIFQLLTTTRQEANKLNDRRAEVYALGMLGHLYEQTSQWTTARSLTEKALMVAQSINAPDISFQWQWQLGRILNAQGNKREAVYAYQTAVDTFQSLRSDLVTVNRESQFSFLKEGEPVYRELIDLLLQPRNELNQSDIMQARRAIESLQLASLDYFLHEAFVYGFPISLGSAVNREVGTAIIYPFVLPSRLAVIVSLPNGSLRYYSTALPQAELEKTLAQLRQSLVVSTTSEYLPLSRKVYDWLIRPIEPELTANGITTLVFVPDRTLQNLPMVALHDGKQYLVEKYAVGYSLGLQLLNPRSSAPSQIRVLAAGLSEPRAGSSSLPSVALEINQIASVIPSRTLLNEEFTSFNLQQQIGTGRFPIVHLATKGQFSSNLEDTFLLTWDGRINARQIDRLFRSRDLRQPSRIELLVLSRLRSVGGEQQSTMGLTGVAIRSGAGSTIAPLWLVEDKATTLLMTRFYREWIHGGTTKTEALRRAQESLLHEPQYQHPFYWAPFVLIGDWR